MTKRVVITGLGILAGNGKGRKEFWESLKAGKIGYRPITLFDTSEFTVKQAGEVSDFDPTVYMGTKGCSIKSRIGECYSVSGAFAVAAALAAIKENFIPPTVNYKEPDPDCDLDIVANVARKVKVKNVLVVNFGPAGSNLCLTLRKVEK